jgi:hypothetical protein
LILFSKIQEERALGLSDSFYKIQEERAKLSLILFTKCKKRELRSLFFGISGGAGNYLV